MYFVQNSVRLLQHREHANKIKYRTILIKIYIIFEITRFQRLLADPSHMCKSGTQLMPEPVSHSTRPFGKPNTIRSNQNITVRCPTAYCD